MSHRDSLIKTNKELAKPMDLMNVGFVGVVSGGGDPGALELSDSDLVSYTKFNDNFLDTKGSNNGTLTGGSGGFVTGKIGKAYNFTGSSYVSLANESNFDFERDDPFSISLWVRPSSTSATTILAKGTTHFTSTGIYLSNVNIGGGQVRFRFQINAGGSNYEVWTSANSLANTTYYLTCTYDGNSNKDGLKIYRNGSLDTTGASNPITASLLNNEQFAIGATSTGGTDFSGWVDELSVWSKSLTADNVSWLYNSGSGNELV
tara:strand:- start:342 stop:1124 length:783 start_codon:yes stop_codon:yes gene_type:complete